MLFTSSVGISLFRGQRNASEFSISGLGLAAPFRCESASLYEAVTLAGQRFSSEEKESKIGISPSRTQRKITFKFEIGDPLLLRSMVEMKLMAHGYDSVV